MARTTLTAEFTDPAQATRAGKALQALGAPSLSIGAQTTMDGTLNETRRTSGAGLLDQIVGALFSTKGKGTVSVGGGASTFKGRRIGSSFEKSWGGAERDPRDDVVEQTFSGAGRTTMTVQIDDEYADRARAVLQDHGATLSQR